MTRIAVTGASGHLGRRIVKGLVQRMPAPDVVAILRDRAKAEPLEALGVTVRIADYDDRASFDAALEDIDKLMLVSASELHDRVSQHRNVLDAAKARGIGRIVYTSVLGAAETELVIAPDHAATEALIRSGGQDFTFLRNGWYSENYIATLEQARATGQVITASGKGRVASASRDDYADAAVHVLTEDGHGGRTYELSGDVAWDYDELGQMFQRVLGKPVATAHVDAETLRRTLAEQDLPTSLVDFLVAVDGNIAAGALELQTGELAKLIGRPTTPIEATMRAHLSET